MKNPVNLNWTSQCQPRKSVKGHGNGNECVDSLLISTKENCAVGWLFLCNETTFIIIFAKATD